MRENFNLPTFFFFYDYYWNLCLPSAHETSLLMFSSPSFESRFYVKVYDNLELILLYGVRSRLTFMFFCVHIWLFKYLLIEKTLFSTNISLCLCKKQNQSIFSTLVSLIYLSILKSISYSCLLKLYLLTLDSVSLLTSLFRVGLDILCSLYFHVDFRLLISAKMFPGSFIGIAFNPWIRGSLYIISLLSLPIYECSIFFKI